MKGFSWKTNKNKLLGLITLLVLWQVIAIGINKEIYLPKLQNVFIELLEIIKERDFYYNVLCSLLRTSISFILALLLAIILGILVKVYPFFKDFLVAFNAIGKTIPTMVLVVLALIWFDKNMVPYVVGFLIVFPILYEGIVSALNSVDNGILDMCKIYNVSLVTKIKKIYFNVIMNYVAEIFMSSFSLTFKVVIAGEVHGRPEYGIGSAIQYAKVNFEITEVYSWIVLIAIVSIIFEYLNKLLLRKMRKWE